MTIPFLSIQRNHLPFRHHVSYRCFSRGWMGFPRALGERVGSIRFQRSHVGFPKERERNRSDGACRMEAGSGTTGDRTVDWCAVVQHTMAMEEDLYHVLGVQPQAKDTEVSGTNGSSGMIGRVANGIRNRKDRWKETKRSIETHARNTKRRANPTSVRNVVAFVETQR